MDVLFLKKVHQLCFLLKALVDLAPKYILEQFMEAELMVNITEHEVSDSFKCCLYPWWGMLKVYTVCISGFDV